MKLTKGIRTKILYDIDADVFEQKRKVVNEKLINFGDELYEVILGKYIPEMKKLPESFFNKFNYIECAFGGKRYFVHMSADRLIPINLRELTSFPVDSPYSDKFTSLMAERESIRKESLELRSDISSLLDSCTTIDKLLSIWPEGSKWIEKYNIKTGSNLPAIQIKDLNKKLCVLIGKDLSTYNQKGE